MPSGRHTLTPDQWRAVRDIGESLRQRWDASFDPSSPADAAPDLLEGHELITMALALELELCPVHHIDPEICADDGQACQRTPSVYACPVCGTISAHHFDIRDGVDIPARFIPCPVPTREA